jgi:hypothetical protein
MENNKSKIIGNFIIIRSPLNIRINYTRKTATIRPTRTAKRVLNCETEKENTRNLEYKIRIDVLPTKS